MSKVMKVGGRVVLRGMLNRYGMHTLDIKRQGITMITNIVVVVIVVVVVVVVVVVAAVVTTTPEERHTTHHAAVLA